MRGEQIAQAGGVDVAARDDGNPAIAAHLRKGRDGNGAGTLGDDALVQVRAIPSTPRT
jgi:hypothetical protein